MHLTTPTTCPAAVAALMSDLLQEPVAHVEAACSANLPLCGQVARGDLAEFTCEDWHAPSACSVFMFLLELYCRACVSACRCWYGCACVRLWVCVCVCVCACEPVNEKAYL